MSSPPSTPPRIAIFDDAKRILAEETASCKATFDHVFGDKLSDHTTDLVAQRTTFDGQVQAGKDDFDATYLREVHALQQHMAAKRQELESTVSKGARELYKYREDKLQHTMHEMLQMVYAVRVQLDAADDFLGSPALEKGSDAHTLLVTFQQLLRLNTRDEDTALFAKFFAALTGSPAPSTRFDVIFPQMVMLMSKAALRSSAAKSAFYSTAPPFDAGVAHYAKGAAPSPLWPVLAQVFGVLPCCPRIDSGRVVSVPDMQALQFYATMHALNRHRDGPNAPPATVEGNRKFVQDGYASHPALDPVLVSTPSYYTPDGLSALFQRTGLGLLLVHDSASDCYVYEVASGFVPKDEWNYGIDCRAVFDSRMQLQSIEIDGSLAALDDTADTAPFRRVVASAINVLSCARHLGVQHHIVADKWIDSFFQNTREGNVFTPLIKTLAMGVADSISAAAFVLVNDLPTCIISTGSGLKPRDIGALCKTHVADVPAVAHWDHMKARIGPKDTPMKRSLQRWWDTISAFVDSYVAAFPAEAADAGVLAWIADVNAAGAAAGSPSLDLADVLKTMVFNQPLHELSSNPQLLYDLVENKMAFSTRRDTLVPAQLVHERVLGTVEAVTGDTPRFESFSMASLTDNASAAAIFDEFQRQVAAMAPAFGASSDEGLLPMLHPGCVECSIAW